VRATSRGGGKSYLRVILTWAGVEASPGGEVGVFLTWAGIVILTRKGRVTLTRAGRVILNRARVGAMNGVGGKSHAHLGRSRNNT